MNPNTLTPGANAILKAGSFNGQNGTSYKVGSPEAANFLLSGGKVAAPAEPTVGQVYNAPDTGAATGAAIDKGINLYGGISNAPIDEGAIRSQTLAQFQKEIDAANSIYAEKLAEAKQQGLGRLGSARAIQARSGTLGSDFAGAQNDNVTTQNNGIENSINSELASKIAEITDKATSMSSAEIAAKRTAQTQGLDSYLKYLGAKTDRQTTGMKTIANSFIDQKIDPSTVDPKQLKTIADSYGVTPDALMSVYATEKKTADEAQAKKDADAKKAAADAAKTGLETVSEGQQLYQFDPVTGTYKSLGKNPKTSAPKAPVIPKGVKPVNSPEFKSDVSDAISQFQTKMAKLNWKGINPQDYQLMANHFLQEYGTTGLSKFKTAVAASNLKVDNSGI